MLLTFEISKISDSELNIYCDEEGLSLLIKKLEILKGQKSQSHEHLMTPSWSGNELTEEVQDINNFILNKVTITRLMR